MLFQNKWLWQELGNSVMESTQSHNDLKSNLTCHLMGE